MKERLKILLAGDWRFDVYEESTARALESLGHIVHPFRWSDWRTGPTLLDRLQERLLAGPTITAINDALLESAARFEPDIIFVYRGTHILAETLRDLRLRTGGRTRLVSYVNDDPFSPAASHLLWRHLKSAIPHYDMHFVYRHGNLRDFRKAGSKRTALLRSGYVPWMDTPVEWERDEQATWSSDVIFAGHYEPDDRATHLAALGDAGINLRLYGTGWERLARKHPLRMRFSGIHPLHGTEYRKAIAGTKVSLAFMSALNRDTYTRRHFEIPAVGSFLLSAFSSDLASLFEEGREIEFFRNTRELVEKTRYYLAHDDERIAIATRGRQRVISNRHDVVSRMRDALEAIYAPEGARTGSPITADAA